MVQTHETYNYIYMRTSKVWNISWKKYGKWEKTKKKSHREDDMGNLDR